MESRGALALVQSVTRHKAYRASCQKTCVFHEWVTENFDRLSSEKSIFISYLYTNLWVKRVPSPLLEEEGKDLRGNILESLWELFLDCRVKVFLLEEVKENETWINYQYELDSEELM